MTSVTEVFGPLARVRQSAHTGTGRLALSVRVANGRGHAGIYGYNSQFKSYRAT